MRYTTRPASAAFHAGDLAGQNAWAIEHEAGVLRQPGYVPVCCHNWVDERVQRDPTIDNNEHQAKCAAACVERQLAELRGVGVEPQAFAWTNENRILSAQELRLIPGPSPDEPC
jgi:hypothetical protein